MKKMALFTKAYKLKFIEHGDEIAIDVNRAYYYSIFFRTGIFLRYYHFIKLGYLASVEMCWTTVLRSP